MALLAACVAGFMAMMVRAGISPNLRVAIRTTLILALVWIFAYANQKPISLLALSWSVRCMVVLSGLAIALAWFFHFRGLRQPETPSVAPMDRINVLFAALFAVLLLYGPSAQRFGLGALLLVSGALILSWNRN
ncbi:MAG: EamA family transporter [Verrucomicrobia bacterium]|nr:EamA family transporter [Verrucomicrobiota bacterium]